MEPGYHRWEEEIDPNEREEWGDGFIHSHSISHEGGVFQDDEWGKFARSLRPSFRNIASRESLEKWIRNRKWKRGPDGASYKAVEHAVRRRPEDHKPGEYQVGCNYRVFRKEA